MFWNGRCIDYCYLNTVFQEVQKKLGLASQGSARMPPEACITFTSLLAQVLALLFSLFLLLCTLGGAPVSSSTWVLGTHQAEPDGVQALSFDLNQSQLLQVSGKSTLHERSLPLSGRLSTSTKTIFKNHFIILQVVKIGISVNSIFIPK